MFSGVLDGIMSSGVLDGNNTDEENVTLFRGDVVSRHCLATLSRDIEITYNRHRRRGRGPVWSGPRQLRT
jgi:hypothetical protein